MVRVEVPLSLHIEELNESNWHEKINLWQKFDLALCEMWEKIYFVLN